MNQRLSLARIYTLDMLQDRLVSEYLDITNSHTSYSAAYHSQFLPSNQEETLRKIHGQCSEQEQNITFPFSSGCPPIASICLPVIYWPA